MGHDVKALSRELHRRKILAGCKDSMTQTFVEISMLDLYDRDLLIDDIRTSVEGIHFAAADSLGQSVRVIVAGEPNWKIPLAYLGDDVYMMATIDDTRKVIFRGWLPYHEVEASELFNMAYYEVDDEHLLMIPDTFKFMFPCPDVPCTASGIWDETSDSWDCFQCGRMRYDYAGKQGWPQGTGEPVESSVNVAVPARTEEPERSLAFT